VDHIPVRVITEAYKRIGITIDIRRFPSERAIRISNNGDADGEMMRQKGVERDYPNLLRVPVAIFTGEMVVVTKDKKFLVKGWKSLIPYKVGYVRGVKAIEKNLVQGTYAEAVTTGEQAYRKLNAGRTDVVIDSRSEARHVLKKLDMPNLFILEPPLVTVPFFHYLHVKNQHLLKPLTKVLQQMKKEGIMQRTLGGSGLRFYPLQ
jgi:polar amino acid transport system substrate-binding protein